MVRPGPKGTQKEVRTEIIRLLVENSQGLSFNKMFKALKERQVLGSNSVLSTALKDLSETKIITSEEKQEQKIPTRIYKLIDPKLQNMLRGYEETKKVETAKVQEFMLDEDALHSFLVAHVNNLIGAYRSLLFDSDPSSQDARWRYFAAYEAKSLSNFLESAARAVTDNKVSVDEADKKAARVLMKIMKSDT